MEHLQVCNNFATKTLELLNQTEKGGCVVLVTTQQLLKKYSTKLNHLQKNWEQLTLVVLENFACCNQLFVKNCTEKVPEQTKLLLVFGAGNLCDLVKSVANLRQLPLIVIPSVCSSGGYFRNFYLTNKGQALQPACDNQTQYVVVDQQIIAESPTKLVASCYGELAAMLLTLQDCVYLKTAKNQTIETSLLQQLQQQIYKIMCLPASVLVTPFGKNQLFQTYLECEDVLNQIGLQESAVFSMAKLLYVFCNKNVSYGNVCLVCATILVSVSHQFFAAKQLSVNHLPNVELRMHKLKSILNSKNNTFLYTLETSNQEVANVIAMQPFLLKLTQMHQKNLSGALDTFKNLHNDKAVFLNRFLTKGAVVNALCMAPDVYVGNTILSLMRNLGLLELNK